MGRGFGRSFANDPQIIEMRQFAENLIFWGYWGGVAVATILAISFLSWLSQFARPTFAFLDGAARRKRTYFEKAAGMAILSVALPILVAQIGIAAGPLLPPAVGWKIYVYASLVSGVSATLLGGLALLHGEKSSKTRAIVSTIMGVIVVGLVYGSTVLAIGWHSARLGRAGVQHVPAGEGR